MSQLDENSLLGLGDKVWALNVPATGSGSSSIAKVYWMMEGQTVMISANNNQSFVGEDGSGMIQETMLLLASCF